MILCNTVPDIEGLISDLAFILLLGAVVTLLFKWIRQPVVLGYIVAGFLASPNFKPLPSVTTEANIEFWAQIGIIVLLFSLGLEFSFKKLVNTGGSAVVTALIIVLGMMGTGFAIGHLLGFTTINSLFLGGMLSMSSTTIIIKAFTDLNLRQKKFASLVFAVLIVEDLFAVVMMVVLSSIAINNSVEGAEMLMSISKLVFFLVIWFLVGVYILPSFLNRTRRFLNNETLLVVSMGLCLSMAVFSVLCGFSMALGAFVMGSILAGTSYAERIEHVTMPVKDLFGSVFFISVGMMVQPAILIEYWWPILLLSAVVIVGMIHHRLVRHEPGSAESRNLPDCGGRVGDYDLHYPLFYPPGRSGLPVCGAASSPQTPLSYQPVFRRSIRGRTQREQPRMGRHAAPLSVAHNALLHYHHRHIAGLQHLSAPDSR